MEKRDEKGRYLIGTGAGPGRNCGYDPAMDEQAYKLSLLGLTEDEMARFFDVSRNTFYRWKVENPGFRDAVYSGKEIADAEVALALYKRAAGMSVKSEKAMKGQNGEIVITQTVTEVPPDTKAAIHWLQLRRRHSWNATSKGVAPEANECPKCAATATLSDEELQARIKMFTERRQFDYKAKRS